MNTETLATQEEKISKEEKNWAVLLHITPLCVFLGIPFGNIIAPLVLWYLKRDESEFLDSQGIEAINFQISWTVYILIAAFLCFLFVGFLIIPVLLIMSLIFMVQATKHISQGQSYKYPWNIQWISD